MFNLLTYLNAFNRIAGWFSFDAAILFSLYRQVVSFECPPGDTLEIGVHHGLSAIAIAALRGDHGSFVAIDLFEELQSLNESRSGDGNRTLFENHIGAFYPDLSFLKIMAGSSADLTPSKLGCNFTFCHIDGGHSRPETFHDLQLCTEIVKPGGLIAIDDYFNPLFPGVCEGAIEFLMKYPAAMTPLAIGYNKVLFQKAGASSGTNAQLSEQYPMLLPQTVQMWGQPVLLFPDPIRKFFDLQRSTFGNLVLLTEHGIQAQITVTATSVTALPDSQHSLSVSIENTSDKPLPAGEKVFGLSYHLLAPHGATLMHDNDRTWILESLPPGETITRPLTITAPHNPGAYMLEIDLVWEGVLWFRDAGNATPLVGLTVAS